MKAFAATLLFASIEASRPSYYNRGGYGRSYGGYGGYSSKLVAVKGYATQARSKTVLDNVQQQIRVPRNVQTKRTVFDTINQTVYDNVSHTVIDNVPRKVIDEITKTVIDNVPTTVIDKVQETRYNKSIINESNDSGDGYNSGEGIYVDSVSSISSASDSCDWWCQKQGGWGKKAAWGGYGSKWGKKNYGGYSGTSQSSQSSYYITSDSSADEKEIITPETITKNVARTVIKQVPRQVKEQRERTVIDKIPRTVNRRVARNIQKKVPRTITENKTVYDTKIINKQVPRTVTELVKVPTTSYKRVLSKNLSKRGGYGGYSKGYGSYGRRSYGGYSKGY